MIRELIITLSISLPTHNFLHAPINKIQKSILKKIIQIQNPPFTIRRFTLS
jgi:hypothetical protein